MTTTKETRTRALSDELARTCEEAKNPRCRCRCGGLFHGASRGGVNAPESFYESLPADDPHHTPAEEEREFQKRLQRAMRGTIELLVSLILPETPRPTLHEILWSAAAALGYDPQVDPEVVRDAFQRLAVEDGYDGPIGIVPFDALDTPRGRTSP